MKISLAIINDNKASYLKRYFESLNGWEDALNIIFVDNCSGDNSVQIAKTFGIEKIVTFDKKSVSRAVLYNAAIDKAEGEYILFTHSDIVFSKDFFKNLQETLIRNPDIDFMNFQIKYVDKNIVGPNVLYWDFEGCKLYYKSIWGWPNRNHARLISCSGPCFLADRKIVEYERFNERYLHALFVEELFLTLISQGAIVFNNEDSYVEHYFVDEHVRLKTQKNDIRLFMKHNFGKNILLQLQLMQLPIIEKDQQIAQKDEQLRQKDEQLAEKDRQIEQLLNSRSWRITAPLRWLHSKLIGKR